MSLSITLVRHARSEANAAGIWQGQGDAPLSAEGHRQAEDLAGRLAGRRFDVVVSSDLTRTQQTAEISGHRPGRVDSGWREMNLGDWEGRTFDEVRQQHPDLLEAIRSGEAVSFGGTGETIAEFEERCLTAFDALITDMGGEGNALVFAHGGVIDSIVGRYFGRVQGRRTFPIVTNTSLTTFIGVQNRSGGRARMASFNDAAHLGHDVGALGHFRSAGVPVVGLVRHGVTEANKVGRIQGHLCWGLHPEGHQQAENLSDWYGPVDRVWSSPIQRARETAEKFGRESIDFDDRLKEQSFGEWEGVLTSELPTEDADVMRRIYGLGQDLPRGRTGETFADLTNRLKAFVDGLAVSAGERTVVVSHGAAIKALIAAVLGDGADIQSNLAVSPNTGISHVAFPDDGPMLLDYAIAPHLDESGI